VHRRWQLDPAGGGDQTEQQLMITSANGSVEFAFDPAGGAVESGQAGVQVPCGSSEPIDVAAGEQHCQVLQPTAEQVHPNRPAASIRPSTPEWMSNATEISGASNDSEAKEFTVVPHGRS
jgi:hypothetical protein